MSAPILDLSKLAPERPRVKLPQGSFELKLADDLSPLDFAVISRFYEQQSSIDFSKPDAEQAAGIDQVVRTALATITLDWPTEVLESLSFIRKVAILDFFGKQADLMGVTPTEPEPAPNRAARRTGARSSRGSSGSGPR